MNYFQPLHDVLASIQDFFTNAFFPWMITWGATSTTIWFIGFIFTFTIWSLWSHKLFEDDSEEVKEWNTKIGSIEWLRNDSKLKATKIVKAGIFERCLMYIILFLLLIVMWPMFLGAYVFIITKNKTEMPK